MLQQQIIEEKTERHKERETKIQREKEREKDRLTEGQRDKYTKRQKERQKGKKTQRDRETEIQREKNQKDLKPERLKDRQTGRQIDRKAERERHRKARKRDRKAERPREQPLITPGAITLYKRDDLHLDIMIYMLSYREASTIINHLDEYLTLYRELVGHSVNGKKLFQFYHKIRIEMELFYLPRILRKKILKFFIQSL